jgi:thiol-disulfide isomerase/thioredoxin
MLERLFRRIVSSTQQSNIIKNNKSFFNHTQKRFMSFSNVQLEFVKGDALDIAAEAKKHTPMVIEFWATVCKMFVLEFFHVLTSPFFSQWVRFLIKIQPNSSHSKNQIYYIFFATLCVILKFPFFFHFPFLFSGMFFFFLRLQCPPCRTSIPHLTELQKKYSSIKFIGVSNEARSAVEPFVQQQGSKMDYRVALDLNGSANQEFMAKVGARGIPTAFVIDKTGRVKWHGHPMSPEFEQELEAVQNQRAPAEKNTKSRDELNALSVKELKEILAAHNISAVGLLEKGDIVERILDKCS